MPNIKNIDFSTDGVSWTSASVNVSTDPLYSTFEQGLVENDITSIDNTNYIWGAIGKNGLMLKSNQINNPLGTFDLIYNKNLQDWILVSDPGSNGTQFSVAHANGLWVVGGRYGQIRTSTDAITWTTRISNFGNTQIQSVAYGNDVWVAGGYTGQLRISPQINTNFKSYFIGADYA